MPVSRRDTVKPYWQSECGRVTIYVGDCLKVMAKLEPSQFHAVVTDPPYGLEFMGKEWDAPWKSNGSVDARSRRADEMDDPTKAKYLRHNVEYGLDTKKYQEWFEERASMILRVAKPGAHLLSFGGTRMYHRMACAIEDAGFELRDCIMWLYGSGFPKGMDASKALDKLHKADRKVTGTVDPKGGTTKSFENYNRMAGDEVKMRSNLRRDEPVTEDAIKWQGWNTALKPSFEPIIVARKEMCGSVAQNLLKYECGAINIDGCKVEAAGEVLKSLDGVKNSGTGIYGFNRKGDNSMDGSSFTPTIKTSRHPANVIHDGSDEVVSLLPDGAARFFYTAKAGDSDRPHGRANTHPTVKPLDLMQYLVRLVCVKGGVVLDPFMGSGSTGCAAVTEGMRFVGIEQDEHYTDIAIGKLRLALGTK